MWHLSPVTFVWIYKVEGLEFGGLEAWRLKRLEEMIVIFSLLPLASFLISFLVLCILVDG